MKKNDIYELEITGMTHEGMGVGKIDGMAVFVQGAVDGERVKVKLIKIAKNYGIARVEEWIKESSQRLEPFCPVYKSCGGCSLQHMTYKKQLEFKHQMVIDNLARIGGFKDISVNSVIGMNDPMHYRNKAQYPVGLGKDGPTSGFYAKRTHEIIECEACGIQDKKSGQVQKIILREVRETGIPIYNEKTAKGILRHIITRVSRLSGEMMIILVVTSEKVPFLDQLIQRITNEIPEVVSIVLNINKRRDNVILSDHIKTVYGTETLKDKLGSFYFYIPPLAFYQVNSVQTVVLYEKAIEFAGLTGSETVFDLYSGIGTLSLFLAQKAKKVVGVEVVEEAVRAARHNAEINKINNTEFHRGKAEDIVPTLYKQGIKADVVVVDPPRKGCDQQLLNTMIDMQPKRIVYVSCNPSTLARDLKQLHEQGYTISETQPVDMFPWTPHVETICLMSKK